MAKSLAGFFYNKVRKNAFLSVVLYKDGKYYIALSDLIKQDNLDGKLIISLFPKSELTEENIPRMEEHVICEVDGNKVAIYSRRYKHTFLEWVSDFRKETKQEIETI